MRYADAAHTLIDAGDGRFIPVVPGNPDYAVLFGFAIDPYVAPSAPIVDISDRQFFQGLALRDFMTQAEALAAVQVGALPAAFETAIGQLPAGDQFDARMLLTGATTFMRSNPMTILLAGLLGWTSEQTDDFWRFCAAL